jgi:hypothetical protein
MNSTVAGVNLDVPSMIDPVEPTAQLWVLAQMGSFLDVGSDTRLASTVFGVNSNMYSTTSWNLATQTGNVYQYSRGFRQDWSTPVSTVAIYTSNTSNWAKNIQQDTSTFISSLSTR